jgi:hypothetical protein
MISKQIDEEKFFKKDPLIVRVFERVLKYLGFYKIQQGLINIKHWLPIIWKDREFDYEYFEIILVNKIKLMKDFYESEDPCSMDAPQVAKQMEEVLALFKRLRKDRYVEELEPFGFIMQDIKFEDTEDGLGRRAVFPGTEEERKERMNIYIQADLNRKEDRKRAYALLAEHMEYWWD